MFSVAHRRPLDAVVVRTAVLGLSLLAAMVEPSSESRPHIVSSWRSVEPCIIYHWLERVPAAFVVSRWPYSRSSACFVARAGLYCQEITRRIQHDTCALPTLQDDLGYGNVGWHRKGAQAVPEVQTPAMDSLVAEGVALERVYSYACCSPTRSSFISGRLPIHVNILNTDPASFNPTTGEGAGIATNMTGIGEVLTRGSKISIGVIS